MKLILKSIKSIVRSDKSWSKNITKSKSWSKSLTMNGSTLNKYFYLSRSWNRSFMSSWKKL